MMAIAPSPKAVSSLGRLLVEVVIKTYTLIGEGCMRKVSPKHASVKYEPVECLMNLEENGITSEQDEALVEQFLIQMWEDMTSKINALKFDHLRLIIYNSMTRGIDVQLPTSNVIWAHIHRATFILRRVCHLLAGQFGRYKDETLEAVYHGWKKHTDVLLQAKNVPLSPYISCTFTSVHATATDLAVARVLTFLACCSATIKIFMNKPEPV